MLLEQDGKLSDLDQRAHQLNESVVASKRTANEGSTLTMAFVVKYNVKCERPTLKHL